MRSKLRVNYRVDQAFGLSIRTESLHGFDKWVAIRVGSQDTADNAADGLTLAFIR
jgi:hypothetical protein